MKYSSLLFLVLLGFNAFVWRSVIFDGSTDSIDWYFLDVGQGDSTLVNFYGNMQVLVDGGFNKRALENLGHVLPPTDRYIDLIVVSHGDMDHFAGLIPVLERYRVGAVAYNGLDGNADAWGDFVAAVKEKNIPVVILGVGDTIVYKDVKLNILSPEAERLVSPQSNDASLVILAGGEGVRTLLTGDIGFAVENLLVERGDVDIDILKVAHHGSKYSSGAKFLREATPLVSIVQVGKNRYGHPSETVLNRLGLVGSSIYRNDDNGTIHVRTKEGVMTVFTQR